MISRESWKYRLEDDSVEFNSGRPVNIASSKANSDKSGLFEYFQNGEGQDGFNGYDGFKKVYRYGQFQTYVEQLRS